MNKMDWLGVANKSNNTISGVKNDSLTHFHEQGHLIYCSNPLYNRMNLAEEQFRTLSLLFIVVGIAFDMGLIILGSLLAILFSVGLGIFEEYWCWRYAWQKKKQMNEQTKILQ